MSNLLVMVDWTLKSRATQYRGNVEPDANELIAANGFSKLGYDVTHKATASDKGVQGVKTQDLWVDGIGKVDVYTPTVVTPKSILIMIEKKNLQTNAIIIQVNLAPKEIHEIVGRAWGKSSTENISKLFFQNKEGRIIRFDWPIKRIE